MDDWRQQVSAHVRNGEKIAAIKVYREATGMGLKEAKDFVEALEQTLATGELPPVEAPATSSEEAELVELVRSGRKIEAVKLYRERHGVGLKEAKDAVEALAGEAGIPPGKGCAAVLTAAVLQCCWGFSADSYALDAKRTLAGL